MGHDIDKNQTKPSPQELDKALRAYYGPSRSTMLELRSTYAFLADANILEAFGLYQHQSPCERCGDIQVSTFASRTAKTPKIRNTRYIRQTPPKEKPVRERVVFTEERYKVFFPYCRSCGHVSDTSCDCVRCEETRAINRQMFIDEYSNKYGSHIPIPEIETLDAQTSFYLAWFLSYGDLTNVTSCSSRELVKGNEHHRPELPSLQEDEMAEALRSMNVVRVDLTSVHRAVEMTSTEDHTFHQERLIYTIPYEADGLYQNLKRHCRELFNNEGKRESVLDVMGHLAIREAIVFYYNLSKRWKLPFETPAELYTNLRFGINTLGLFRTIYCIEKSVRFGAMLVNEKNAEPIKAARAARSGLYKNWLNRDDERRWKSQLRHRDDLYFREPALARLFQDLFLPFTLEYGVTPLSELSTYSSEGTAIRDDTSLGMTEVADS